MIKPNNVVKLLKNNEFKIEKVQICRKNLSESFGFTINSIFEGQSLKSICISSIKSDTPAYKSRLKCGDQLLKLNDKPINNIEEFHDILRVIKSSL